MHAILLQRWVKISIFRHLDNSPLCGKICHFVYVANVSGNRRLSGTSLSNNFQNWISTFFLTTKLNTVDNIWRFRLYLCLTQKFNFTEVIAHQSHRIPIQTCYFTIRTFIPSSKWRIFPRKGLYTKHPRKRLARNNRWFPTTLKTFAEKCIMVTINMNWRLTKIDFDLMLNIQDTPS